MKNLFISIGVLLLTTSIRAQSPQKMTYQAVIREAGNNLVASHIIGIRISILKTSASGTAVYTETQTPTTNANGLLSIEIGGQTGFNTINWADGPYFIKTETDPAGGTNYTITGTSQLLTVPYALYAKTAETADYNSLSNKPSGTNTGDMLYWNGANWVIVPVGETGQTLQLNASKIPVWSGARYPVLSTTGASTLTFISAMSGGYILSDGGSPVTARGVCWDTLPNPTVILSTKTTDSTGTGTFTSTVTGLTVSTKYYLRAYAANSEGVAYGNEISFSTPDNMVPGDNYQGGIVAYILQPGDPGYKSGQVHGLIAAPADQSTGVQWYNGSNIVTGATGTALGTGKANTDSIVKIQGDGTYAAKICADLVLGGYSDWSLPSKDELDILYTNQGVIGGFEYGYWSSSEYSNSEAWMRFFNYDGAYNQNKIQPFYVRAIRSF